MKYPIGMKLNHTWLAFANRKRCRHADAIHSLGFISWRMGRARFLLETLCIFLCLMSVVYASRWW